MKTNESPERIDRQATKRSTAGGGLDESLTSDGVAAEPLGTPEVPTQFGRYRIVKRLGRGGMGSVYLAEDSQLGRNVALKIPRFGPDNQERAIERFQREARAAAVLNHQHLCPVYDVGEIDGVPYLTMAYVDGRPLSDYIHADKGLPQLQVAATVRKIALALAEAHAKGIVHRDLKPANVMINQRKEPIVTDFGLAHFDTQEGTRLTLDGALLGTPSYMAPEQVTGDLEAIGPKSDIYSLGVILYEMLTGRLPFEGPVSAVLGQIIAVEPKPPSIYRAELDPALVAICMKAMAKKIEDRYASMKDLAGAIEAFMRTAPPVAANKEAATPPAASPPRLPPKPTLIETTPKRAPKSTMIESRTPAASANRKPPPVVPDEFDDLALTKPRKKAKKPSRSHGARLWAAAGLALALLLAGAAITFAIIRVQTKIGTVEIDINEPGAEVSIDGQHRITIKAENIDQNLQIDIEEGNHEMIVTKGGFKTETKHFTIERRKRQIVKVTLLPDLANQPPLPDPKDGPKGVAIKSGSANPKPATTVEPKKKDPPIVTSPPPPKKPIVDRTHWIAIMPTRADPEIPRYGRYLTNGILEMRGAFDDGNSGFGGQYIAKDGAIRAVVKVTEGNDFMLQFRGINRPDNGYAYECYTVVFDGRRFKFSKHLVQGKGYRDVVIKEAPSPRKFDDYFEFKVKAVGDLITAEADGEEVLRARDATLDQGGAFAFKVVDRSTALVKSAHMQIMDFTGGVPPEGNSYLPRDKWIDIDPLCGNFWTWDKNDHSRNWLKMEKDVLTLKNGACDLSSIQAKNVSIKASCKFLAKETTGHVAISVRGTKFGDCYYTNCQRKPDGTFVVWMNDQGIERKNVPRDFFDLQVTAVADLVTVHLNGEEVINYRDPKLAMQKVGGIMISAHHSDCQIKSVQVKIMD